MRIVFLLFMLWALLFKHSNALAQLNESDTSRFQLRTSASGAWQGGNVDVLVIRGKLEWVNTGKKKRVVFKSQNNNLYQQFGGKKADNDISSRNYLYWKPQQKLYPFAILYVQTNFRRKVEYRIFGGIGGTFQLLRKKNNAIKMSISILKENTLFATDQFNETQYNGNKQIAVWRGSLYFSGNHKLIGNKLSFYYTGFWQPALNVVYNNRLQCDLGIEFAVFKGISLLSEFVISYEQVVATQVKQIDRVLTFGISYRYLKN